MSELYSMYDDASEITDALDWYNTVNMVNLMLYLLRFFDLVQFQPRLGLISATVGRACTDLAHWAILAAEVLVLYSFLGTILYQSQNEGFKDFGVTCQTMLFLLLGE